MESSTGNKRVLSFDEFVSSGSSAEMDSPMHMEMEPVQQEEMPQFGEPESPEMSKDLDLTMMDEPQTEEPAMDDSGEEPAMANIEEEPTTDESIGSWFRN